MHLAGSYAGPRRSRDECYSYVSHRFLSPNPSPGWKDLESHRRRHTDRRRCCVYVRPRLALHSPTAHTDV